VQKRRRAPRLATRLPGRLTGRVARPVTVVDLSATGCLARCGALLDHGAILDLDLQLEGAGEPLLAKVRVAESYVDGAAPDPAAGYLAGLEFLGLPPRGAERLRRYLDEERRRRRHADAPTR
jgi:PilZ domain-containing protein